MTIQFSGGPFVDRVSGRLLCYVAPNNESDLAVAVRAAALTGGHEASGLVVRGPRTTKLLRSLDQMSAPGTARQPVIVDPGKWTKTVATANVPLDLDADEDVLIPLTLEQWAASWFSAGADAVLTPSGFVESGDWPALKAVLVAGAQVRDPRVATLIATDAAMLDPARLATFLEHVDEQRAGRPLAFVFAAKSVHLARARRMSGLRELLAAFPGSLVVGAEVLAATDVLVHGGTAAIGLLASQRQPRPPGKGGGPGSAGFIPGLFLRELWETRSPSIYRDWYRNHSAPVCAGCGGRAVDEFTTDPADKEAVLLHNVHAWLKVLDGLRGEDLDQHGWLVRERWHARGAHRKLGPRGAGAPVDPLLAALCELDGPPPQHQPVPAS
ncbi:hypothetical protein [Pseudonocardia nigra]|uniref:hypothetical protein n=1 Tax=Pseudonocardia nigra TaxID=1921578 RepID=UPI001C5E2C60|nr:hypothetical protein [Pseudonocardia nigra]